MAVRWRQSGKQTRWSLASPGLLGVVFGRACDGGFGGGYQLSAGQDFDGALDGAFREAGLFGYALVAERGGASSFGFGLAPDVEVDEEGGGGFVVADEVSHEDI